MLELDLSMAQKAIYKTLSQNVSAKNGSSADFIRSLVRISNGMAKEKKNIINQQIAENNDTKSKRLADEANFLLQQQLEQDIADIKTASSRRASESFEAKRNAVKRFKEQIPKGSTNEKLQLVRDYGHLFDKDLWQIFITDPDITGNSIASKIVQSIASANGIDYVVAINTDRINDNLNQYENMVNIAISHLGEDDDLVLNSLITDNPNSPVSQLIADLDSDISTIIPAPCRTVVNRLKQAEQHAFDVGDVRTSAHIRAFRELHASDLAEPEDIRDALLEQAETLIAQGMSAKGDN